jgi:NADH dehydrogenase
MRDKLVTLFGGSGFVGRYVAQAVMRAGGRIRVAERDPRRAHFLRPQAAIGQMQVVAADLARPDTVARAVEGAHMVVNLVGIMSGNFRAIHVDGAGAVARAAAASGVEALVHLSAIGADPNSASAYGRSKGEGEAAVRAGFAGATILRPSVVFGTEDQFVNRFAGMIERAPVVPILRAGAKFQPVYVVDVADAAPAALSDPARFAGRTFELGGPDVISMGELHRFIADTIGRKARFVDLPDAAGSLLAALPFSPISRDQWIMLQQDNVVAAGAPGLDAFGIAPTALEAIAPGYLIRYRQAGRFGARAAIEA